MAVSFSLFIRLMLVLRSPSRWLWQKTNLFLSLHSLPVFHWFISTSLFIHTWCLSLDPSHWMLWQKTVCSCPHTLVTCWTVSFSLLTLSYHSTVFPVHLRLSFCTHWVCQTLIYSLNHLTSCHYLLVAIAPVWLPHLLHFSFLHLYLTQTPLHTFNYSHSPFFTHLRHISLVIKVA